MGRGSSPAPSDLSEELPLPPPIDVRDARPAPVRECSDAIGHAGAYVLCGHVLREDAGAFPKAA